MSSNSGNLSTNRKQYTVFHQVLGHPPLPSLHLPNPTISKQRTAQQPNAHFRPATKNTTIVSNSTTTPMAAKTAMFTPKILSRSM